MLVRAKVHNPRRWYFTSLILERINLAGFLLLHLSDLWFTAEVFSLSMRLTRHDTVDAAST